MKLAAATRSNQEENSSAAIGLGAKGSWAGADVEFIVRRRGGCGGRRSNQGFGDQVIFEQREIDLLLPAADCFRGSCFNEPEMRTSTPSGQVRIR